MAKINKTQSNKKLKLPNIKRRNNRVVVLKVHSIAMRLPYQMSGLRGKDLLRNFLQYNKSKIYKHWKLLIVSEADCVDRRKNNMGRPKKLTDCYCRLTVRKISELRTNVGSFTLRRLHRGRSVFNPSAKPWLEPERKLFSFDFGEKKWRLLKQEHNAWNLSRIFWKGQKYYFELSNAKNQ